VLGATEATVTGITLGATSVLAGGGASLLDGAACVENPGLNSQCVAAGLGATGVAMSLPESAVALGFASEPAFQEYLALEITGVFVSATANTIDLANQLYDHLVRTSSSGRCPRPSQAEPNV
jgi:hypothetical protein